MLGRLFVSLDFEATFNLVVFLLKNVAGLATCSTKTLMFH